MAGRFYVRVWCEDCVAYKYTTQGVVDDTWVPPGCEGHTIRDFVVESRDCCTYVECHTFTDEGINAAIDQLGAGGGCVMLAEGTYIIDGEITIDQDNTTLMGMGPGTILDASGWTQDAHVINVTGKARTTIRDLAIVGQAGETQAFDLIFVSGSTECLIQNVVVEDADRYGINFVSASNEFKIIGCTIRGGDSVGIYISDSAGGIISNCHLYQNDYGIWLAGSSLNITVIGCMIEENGVYGIYVGSYRVTITGNVIRDCSQGIVIANMRCAVSGNFLYDNGYGISVGGSYCAITGNVVDDSTTNGIYVTTDNNTIAGNQVYTSGNTQDDIYLNTANYCVVSGNVCVGTGGRGERGVYLKDSTFNNIVGNTCRVHDTCGIELDGDSDNNHVAWNQLEGEAIAKIIDAGANNTIMNVLAGVIDLMSIMKTTVGDPGVDTKLVSDQGIREAITALGAVGKVSKMIDHTWTGDDANNREIDLGDDYDFILIYLEENDNTAEKFRCALAFKNHYEIQYRYTNNDRTMTGTFANSHYQGKMTGGDADKIKLGSTGNSVFGTNDLGVTYRLIGFKFSSME